MGNWPKGEIGSNEACALLRERKKKTDKKRRKTKDDVENSNGTSP
jgi:hypothetical protein